MPGEDTKLAVAALVRQFTDDLAARLKRVSDPRNEPKSDLDASFAISEIRESIPRFRVDITAATGVPLPLIGQ